jgi:SAM-dependent methyltransferase
MAFRNSARLHRSVQFMYEQSLAEQELESFGITDFSSTREDLWTYRFNGQGDLKGLVDRSAYFATVNGADSIYKGLILPDYQGGTYNLTRSVNQYLTHWIYPYKGKFHPQMIRALLNILHLRPGHCVLDPFLGSGTTAVECMLMGIDSIGLDISPLCVLIGKVKTGAWRRATEIRDLVQSGRIPSPDADLVVQDFFALAEMVTASDVSVRKRDKDSSYQRNLTRMLRSVTDMASAKTRFGLAFGSVSLHRADSRRMAEAGVADASIDAIITSPPYSVALDYVKNDAHALSAMGQDLAVIREEFIGVRGKPKQKMSLYNQDMKGVFKEMARVLKPGGVAVVVIGNATNGREVTTTEEMADWGAPYGLRYERDLPKIVFGLYNVITDEKLLFFRKEGQ